MCSVKSPSHENAKPQSIIKAYLLTPTFAVITAAKARYAVAQTILYPSEPQFLVGHIFFRYSGTNKTSTRTRAEHKASETGDIRIAPLYSYMSFAFWSASRILYELSIINLNIA